MRLLLFNLATDADDPVLGFALRWIEGLAEMAAHIDVITMRAGRHDLPANVRVYSVGKEKGYSEPRRAVEFYRILLRMLRCHRYDVCFAHMMPLFAVMAAPLLWVKRIPTVLWYTHKSVTWLLRAATFCVDRVVTASADSFRLNSPKVRVIGHGVETQRFLPANPAEAVARPFTVVTVGRLSRIKRLEVLLAAVARFREQNPDLPICLKIVGGPLTAQDQAYAAELKRQVAQQQLQETVAFVGRVPFQEIVPVYQQADCCVNLCPTGGVDKAVLEAMSCGVPVLVANRTFASILGAKLAHTLLLEAEAAQLGDRLRLLAALQDGERRQFGRRLREIVVHDHDLTKLCERLIQELRELQMEDF